MILETHPYDTANIWHKLHFNSQCNLVVDEQNLLFIGAILSIALGGLSLRLVRQNSKLPWNEAIAAHILCLMFITKGIQNAAFGYVNSNAEGDVWQFWFQLAFAMDYIFESSIMAIALLYPVPILRNIKQVKTGLGLVAFLALFRLTLDAMGFNLTPVALPGFFYFATAVIWGSVYIKFRLIPKEKQNQSTQNISLLSGLFTTLVLGHIWMWWPGFILQSEYFYFLDPFGQTLTTTTWDYIWVAGYAIGIAAGLTIITVEIYQAIRGNMNVLLYVVSPYFVLGIIGFLVYSQGSDAGFSVKANTGENVQLWSTFTTGLHFTIVRPLIAMYILLKFNLLDINEKTKPMAKTMVIVLIVVATSAILELVQSIIPINQMISAALLGILIALGLGWEEKSFQTLVSNPAHLRKNIDSKWFPKLDISRRHISRIEIVCLLYCLISLLVSFFVWELDIILGLIAERGG